MKKNDIEGLLLCAKCENQLRVDVYSKKFGFFTVSPCEHCPTEPITDFEKITQEIKDGVGALE